MSAMTIEKAKGKPRGFATMTKEQQREIASLGGKAAHASGNARKWTPEEAKRMGEAGADQRFTSARAAEVGRIGGLKRAKNLRASRDSASAPSSS